MSKWIDSVNDKTPKTFKVTGDRPPGNLYVLPNGDYMIIDIVDTLTEDEINEFYKKNGINPNNHGVLILREKMSKK